MKIIATVEAGYFRGDLSAARYLAMSRKTFAKLMRASGAPRPAIRGGFRYWSKAKLDEYMTESRGTAYTVRPALAALNRQRAARAATGIKNTQHESTENEQ